MKQMPHRDHRFLPYYLIGIVEENITQVDVNPYSSHRLPRTLALHDISFVYMHNDLRYQASHTSDSK